jgi:phage I-like protein
VKLSNEYKGSIDLLIDFEHQFDRSRTNGQPAPAAAWIKELRAHGPDGSPGVWAKVDWLSDTVELIKAKKYRYLSAAVAHDSDNRITFVPRASLTNQPALDTATALFSSQPQENQVDLLKKMLAALGLAATKTEDEAIAHATLLATFASNIAKVVNVEVATLAAMSADAVTTALRKPLADKLALLSTTAKLTPDATPDAIIAGIQALGVDTSKYVPKSIYDETAARLATLTAESHARLVEEGKKAGKITPALEPTIKTWSVDQLSAWLKVAPVIASGAAPLGDPPDGVATLSAEDKLEAARFGVTEEAYLAAKKAQHADNVRRRAQLGS